MKRVPLHLLVGLIGAMLLPLSLAHAQDANAAQTGLDRIVEFSIQPQGLDTAMVEFANQSGIQVVTPGEELANMRSPGVTGSHPAAAALERLLFGTGVEYEAVGDATIALTGPALNGAVAGQNTTGQRRPGIEEIIVTGQKREERIQDVPIAISAFSMEDLKTSQIAGGPDLHLQVPNMTFTKTNFTGYSIQIRGIGTQAISATTDPAVAVALNQTPFIRNRFFEQEFYDLERLEVLRGPQGTLFGRNATAGVVNLITNKPKFHYEAMGSLDIGNYNSRRWEGMVNLPLVDDKLALRIAGAGTKRDGYVTNEISGNPIDGRDLWSTRVSLRFAPTDHLDMNLIWERFEEEDDRLRSGKQLCHQDDREELFGIAKNPVRLGGSGQADWFSQGCIRASLYSAESFEAPDGFSLPYYYPLRGLNLPIPRDSFDPYLSKTQSRDLRVIESTVEPDYRAVSDIVQLQVNFDLTDNLTLTSESAYNDDEIFSLQDFNRFNTRPGAFLQPDEAEATFSNSYREGLLQPGPVGGIWCDPQLGCSDRVMGVDVSSAESRQFSQELRLSSSFEGPFNFSLGGNFLRYDTEDKYYVFINTLSMFAANSPGDLLSGTPHMPYTPDFDGRECMPQGHIHPDPLIGHSLAFTACYAVDPNPIGSLTDEGHNYFLSRNPYKLISYAAFGEAYYNVTDTLKLTAGLRWSVDKKEAPRIPSALLVPRTVGLTVEEVEKLEWREPTGRLVLDWQPNLGFTDETLLYGSYARGYKAGGSNPPVSIKTFWSGGDGANIVDSVIQKSITKPKTFDAEFVNAFEIGTKNTLADGAITLNLAAFYYDYEGYQISEIVDRSAFNRNFDTEVWGGELEADWWVRENFRLGLKAGYQKTRIADGERAVDLMDRTAGGTHFTITDIPNPDFDPSQEILESEYVAGLEWEDIPDGQEFFAYDKWVVMRPFPTFTENCIVPLYVVAQQGSVRPPPGQLNNGTQGPCEYGYGQGLDPFTQNPFEPLTGSYPGFDPATAPNNGEGFAKDLGGNELPNAPNYTATVTADYIVPLAGDWLATLHTDLYWQSESWWRVFNDHEFSRLDDYFTMNLAAIFINEQSGWDIMAYIKNVTDEDALTGAFLFSDDVGLTTNVFLVEPRLYGVRVTKEWGGGQGTQWLNRFQGLLGKEPDQPSPWSLTLGGSLLRPNDAPYQPIPSPVETNEGFDPARDQNLRLDAGEGGELTLTYRPAEGWRVSGGVRFGKARSDDRVDRSKPHTGCIVGPPFPTDFYCNPDGVFGDLFLVNTSDWMVGNVANNEEHLLVDFEVGRDFGIGSDLESTVSAGIRYAEFRSKTHVDMESVPDWYVPEYGSYFPTDPARTLHFVDTDLVAEREFQGVGPSLTWEGAYRLWGDETGRLDVDMSLSGAVLFGKQETSTSGEELATYYSQRGFFSGFSTLGDPAGPPEATVLPEDRSKSATVPTAGASLGLTYRAGGASIGAGYRWERYLGVIDGGFEEHKDYDRAIDGLYLKVTFGGE